MKYIKCTKPNPYVRIDADRWFCLKSLRETSKRCSTCKDNPDIQSSTKAKQMLPECSDCGGVITPGQIDHVCIRKGPEIQSLETRTNPE